LEELKKAHINGLALQGLTEKACSRMKGLPLGIGLSILQVRKARLDPKPDLTNMIFSSKCNFNYHYQHSHYFSARNATPNARALIEELRQSKRTRTRLSIVCNYFNYFLKAVQQQTQTGGA
jgi:hypothetical protein